MTALRSFVAGRWHAPESGRPIFDPSTEEPIAEVSTDGVDFAEVIAHAREVGGPALRATTFAKRAGMLRALSKALRAGRDELLELSRRNGGATTPDGAFDVDGGSGTLAYYGNVALGFGERASLLDGEGIRLWRDDSFHGRHLWVPRRGVALAINAFNFPVWGFAEKAACALAAGVPMIVKPATATALVAQRAVEMALEAGVLPEGALQLVCGSTGDLIDRLGPQDVLAFTGSAATAATLRDRGALRRHNTRVNVEADSLNAAVLAPGVEVESEVWTTFLKDVVREMRQKTGQKCTAVRRILVPRDALDAVSEALEAALADIVVGDPSEETVTMGPLASAGQLADAEHGVAELREVATLVRGGARVDGVGADPGRGYFFAPTLLRVDDAHAAEVVHEREVFAPVATLVPYDGGSAAEAARIVALGGGTLVTSAYGDDDWIESFAADVAPFTGRLYLATADAAAPGSGIAMPQTLHGGPGRAGGGEELGGRIGIERYLQRLALQGHRRVVDRVADVAEPESEA